MPEDLITSGLDFGGTPRASLEAEHPAIAPLVAAISALRTHRPRTAVSQMQAAMDIIGERDSMMVEF